MMIVNPEKLHKLLLEAALPVVGVSTSGRVDYSRALTAAETGAANAILAAYDPTDYEVQRWAAAETAAANIPQWATWTEAQVVEWLTANISDAKTRTALIAEARMLIALRNRVFPQLRGQQPD